MNALHLALALVITLLPAWIWLERLLPMGLSHRRMLIAGYALLLGMVWITLVMRALSLAGVPFSLTSIGLAVVLPGLAGLLVPRNRQIVTLQPAATGGHVSRAQWAIVALCLALLASRLLALGIEAGVKPVFAWDALQHWSKQAKVFFAQGSVVPHVSLDEWLAAPGAGVYTNMHPDYPITTPLLQAWVAVALGGWHEGLVNLPWLLAWLSLGLIFFSQARLAGVEPVTAVASTYMVLSLPYLNTHVALAGYADLVVALSFLGALCAFANWSADRDRWQAVLAALCALSAPLVKHEGTFWLLSFTPGLALVACGLKRGLALLLAIAVLLVALLAWLPADVTLAGHTLGDMALGYRPAGWRAVYTSFLVHDNWHFLGYLVLASLLLGLCHLKSLARRLAPVGIVILCAIALYLCLYLFTRYSFGAVHMTSLNRVALQIMPGAAFVAVLVFASLSAQATGEPDHRPGKSRSAR